MPDLFYTKADLAFALTFQLKKQTIPLLKEELRYAQFGQEGKHIPGTDVIRFIKKPAVTELAVATYQLNADEVTSPLAEKLGALTKVDITSTPYGRVFAFSRREASYDPLDLVQHAKNELSYDAARLMDTIVRDVLAASGTVVYAGASSSSRITVGATDKLTGADIKKFAPMLRSLNVPFREGELMGVTHPNVAYDIMSDTTQPGGWIDAARYAGSAKIYSGELGTYAGVRFVTTTRAIKFAAAGEAGIDVYASVVGVGDWCLGKASIESLRFTAVPPVPSAADVLGLKWFIGWAVDFGAAILDGTRYLRVESAMTAL